MNLLKSSLVGLCAMVAFGGLPAQADVVPMPEPHNDEYKRDPGPPAAETKDKTKSAKKDTGKKAGKDKKTGK